MRPTRFYSKRQETAVAKATGGRRTANSGATTFSKGDVVLDDWLIECKTCTEERNQFTLKKEWFTKNEEEAFAMGKSYSALVFDFGDGKQNYVISEKMFQQLLNYLKEDK